MSVLVSACRFLGPEKGFEFIQVPCPKPKSNEIVIDVLCCTLCGSDQHTVEGRRKEETPTILGHEIIGLIRQFGTDAPRIDALGRTLQEGDRVTWSIFANCGQCFFCQHDLPQKCQRLLKYGHARFEEPRELRGGLAQVCLLAPGTTIIRLPDCIPHGVATVANCAVATMMAALEPLTGEHRSVLICGAGMLGIVGIAALRQRHTPAIGCIDVNIHRLQIAQSFGADVVARPEELDAQTAPPLGWDVVIDTTGATEAIELALKKLRVGGLAILVGSVLPDRPLSTTPEQIVRRCLTLIGVHNYKPRHLLQAVEFLGSSDVRALEEIIGPWFPLTKITEAFAYGKSHQETLRVGIRVQESI